MHPRDIEIDTNLLDTIPKSPQCGQNGVRMRREDAEIGIFLTVSQRMEELGELEVHACGLGILVAKKECLPWLLASGFETQVSRIAA